MGTVLEGRTDVQGSEPYFQPRVQAVGGAPDVIGGERQRSGARASGSA